MGQRVCTNTSFVPNGGDFSGSSYSPSYLEKVEICNHAMLKLVKKGRAFAFSLDALQRSGQIKKLVINRLQWATKTDCLEGRTCLNPSWSTPKYPSLNDSINREFSDKCYPQQTLPLMPDLAEMACQQRDQYPGEQLAGATVDVSAAYNQFPQSTGAALQQAVQLRVSDGAGGNMAIVVIIPVGMFGHTLAGDVYMQCGRAVDEKHNMGQPVRRSATYLDDGLLMNPLRLIHRSVHDYSELLLKLFGKNLTNPVINYEKVKIWENQLIGIGWKFNFVDWTVQPKEQGMNKMLHRLFTLVPVGATVVNALDLEVLTSTLSWYAAGIPAGTSFISSLFACKNLAGPSRRVVLSVEAQADLLWWRALMIVAFETPGCLAASIDSVRRRKIADLYLITDACTSVGGGAWVSSTHLGEKIDEYGDAAIRWTQDEFIMFESMNVSINVLEYFTVIYYVLLWGEKFRNKIIHVKCDNTSAVSWIVKSRASHSPAADSLAKLFSLYCLRMHILFFLPISLVLITLLLISVPAILNFLNRGQTMRPLVGTCAGHARGGSSVDDC